MKKWFESLYLSLFNNSEGFAARKVTAAILIIMVVSGDVIYFTVGEVSFLSIFIQWLIVHLSAVAFFLGLVTVANLIELKNGKVIKEETTTIVNTSKETVIPPKDEIIP